MIKQFSYYFRKIGEAEDDGEVDFMIYVNHAQYELRYSSYYPTTLLAFIFNVCLLVLGMDVPKWQ